MNWMVALSIFCLFSTAFAADGDILQIEDYRPPEFESSGFIQRPDIREHYEGTVVPEFQSSRQTLEVKSLFYESDGLRVKGFLIFPEKVTQKLPLLIFNRGGNGEYGKVGIKTLAWLSRLARRGYIIAASQYRGNDGSQGSDEFGGRDQNDVLNLLKAVASWPGWILRRLLSWGTREGV